MKKIYTWIMLLGLGMSAMAQTNQAVWVNGEVYTQPMNSEQQAYLQGAVLLDTLQLVMPSAIIRRDTIEIVQTKQLVVHDTTVVVKDSIVYVDLCTPGVAVNSTFAVSDTKKVSFAKGNLQYQPATDTWRFAENQYDYIGWKNQNISASYEDWIDLFGWSADNSNVPFGAGTSTLPYNYEGNFVDWGTNTIGSDTANTWRTLTQDEWMYLFSHNAFAFARVDGVAGLILFSYDVFWTINDSCQESSFGTTLAAVAGPVTGYGDGHCCRTGDREVYRFVALGIIPSSEHGQYYQNGQLYISNNAWEKCIFNNNIFTREQFELLESWGVVFLPAAGEREGASLTVVGEAGYYWSASPSTTSDYNESNAGYIYYVARNGDAGGFILDDSSTYDSPRYKGMSVRLVKDVK